MEIVWIENRHLSQALTCPFIRSSGNISGLIFTNLTAMGFPVRRSEDTSNSTSSTKQSNTVMALYTFFYSLMVTSDNSLLVPQHNKIKLRYFCYLGRICCLQNFSAFSLLLLKNHSTVKACPAILPLPFPPAHHIADLTLKEFRLRNIVIEQFITLIAT